MPSATVPERAKQACETQHPRERKWVEPLMWNERMLAALGNGVKGGRNAFFAERGLFTIPKPTPWRANPDEDTTDWRAVCGRSARTVRREGRREPSLPL